MIKGNRIIAGYGTLIVQGHANTNRLIVKYIQPPKEIGYHVPDGFETLEVATILIDCESYFELKHLLEEVSVEEPVFNFGHWVFDFSQFNEKSVDVFKRGLGIVFNPLPFAC